MRSLLVGGEVVKPIRIVACAGGGVGGIVPARILASISAKYPTFLSNIDLFAGTSTGGLISLSLADGMPADTLAATYLAQGPLIFARDEERFARQIYRAKFSSDGLEAAVTKLIGTKTIGELKGNVFIPTTVVQRSDGGRLPDLLAISTAWRIFERPDLERHNASLFQVSDLALGTCAAPTTFQNKWLGSFNLIDGGCSKNDPSFPAYYEVCRLDRTVNNKSIDDDNVDVRILSLGCGLTNTPTAAGDWGLGQWAKPIAHLIIDAAGNADAESLRNTLGNAAVIVNPPMPSYEIDDAGMMPKLDALATCFAANELRQAVQPDGPAVDVLDWIEKNILE
jgi:uncharacterized protein